MKVAVGCLPGVQSVLTKTWGTFFKNCLEHLVVSFAWVSPEGRNNVFFCLGVALGSVVALKVADSLTQHPARVGKHSLTGDLTP